MTCDQLHLAFKNLCSVVSETGIDGEVGKYFIHDKRVDVLVKGFNKISDLIKSLRM